MWYEKKVELKHFSKRNILETQPSQQSSINMSIVCVNLTFSILREKVDGQFYHDLFEDGGEGGKNENTLWNLPTFKDTTFTLWTIDAYARKLFPLVFLILQISYWTSYLYLM